MHFGSEVHIDAYVDEGELGVDQGIDADAADTGLEAAGSDGLLGADLEGGLLVVDGADFRRLQHTRAAIGEDGLQEGIGQGGGEIAPIDFADVSEWDG